MLQACAQAADFKVGHHFGEGQQKTMLGPEVLDSDSHQEIVFKSTAAELTDKGRWTLRGNLTLRGQTRPVTVQVTLQDAAGTPVKPL
jgi:polyisoprenoid-binding protein YceI